MKPTSSRLAVVLFAAVAIAQEGPPGPAPELKKLEPMIGHWEGSGTAQMEPGKPASAWKSQTTHAWALGKHFVQSDTSITFEGQPGGMQFREYLGWDRENKRYVQVSVNNMGEAACSPVYFVGDEMTVVVPWVREGLPQVERCVSKLSADAMTMTITFLSATGPAADNVQGTFKKVANVKPQALEAAHALMGVDPAMARIARMAGNYDITGQMVMVPGTPPTPIKGTDEVRTLFDGAIVQVVTHGEAQGMAPFEAHSYFAWNAGANCYESVSVDNMGGSGVMQARFAGDNKIVSIAATLMMGMPTTLRQVTELDGHGAVTKAVVHFAAGDHAPYEGFNASYKRRSP